MNAKHLIKLGIPHGEPVRLALQFIHDFIASAGDSVCIADEISSTIAEPQNLLGDPMRVTGVRCRLR